MGDSVHGWETIDARVQRMADALCAANPDWTRQRAEAVARHKLAEMLGVQLQARPLALVRKAAQDALDAWDRMVKGARRVR